MVASRAICDHAAANAIGARLAMEAAPEARGVVIPFPLRVRGLTATENAVAAIYAAPIHDLPYLREMLADLQSRRLRAELGDVDFSVLTQESDANG